MSGEILNKTLPQLGLGLATAVGSLGGFPDAPVWWKELSKNKVFQFLTLWILIFQGGGGQELFWSAFLALIVYMFVTLTKDESIMN